MNFTKEELRSLLDKKVDKILFNSGTKTVFFLDLEALIKRRIEADPSLKMSLLEQALQSED